MAGSLSPKLPWDLANPKWASTINPLLANPLSDGRLISGIKVLTGNNVINHGLNRDLVGYFITRNNANVTFYDAQTTNQRPESTLILVASGAATISLYVF